MGSDRRRKGTLSGAAALKANAPLLIGGGVALYWTLEAFLLGGSGLLTTALAGMALWCLAVAAYGHPGAVDRNAFPLGAPLEGACGALLSGELGAAADTGVVVGGVGHGGATTANLRSAAATHQQSVSPQRNAATAVGTHDGEPTPHVGHFRPQRREASAGAVNTSSAADERLRLIPQTLAQLGGLLSAATTATVAVAADDSRGMVTPTYSEVSTYSFAATMSTCTIASSAGDGGAATVSIGEEGAKSKAAEKAAKAEAKRQRKEEKERERTERRLLREERRQAKRLAGSGGPNDPLYCRSCEGRRPPRTHHCRACDDCVVRYDHHCVWINNCVGAANLKAFFLFLVYFSLTALHFFSSLLLFLFGGAVFRTIHEKPMGYVLAVLLLAFVPCATGGAFVALSFLVSTAKGILANRTAYEVAVDDAATSETSPPAAVDARRTRYDRGHWLANAKEALGADVRLWAVPIRSLRLPLGYSRGTTLNTSPANNGAANARSAWDQRVALDAV